MCHAEFFGDGELCRECVLTQRMRKRDFRLPKYFYDRQTLELCLKPELDKTCFRFFYNPRIGRTELRRHHHAVGTDADTHRGEWALAPEPFTKVVIAPARGD